MAQAVSDFSASNAPSLRLWNQLSSLYNVCTLVCAMMVCIGIQGKMYIFSTVIVVLLSIVSLVLIIIVGAKDKSAWNRTVSDEVLESEKIYTCY